MEKSKKSKKQKLLKLVFGRTTIIIVLILLQFATFVVSDFLFEEYKHYLSPIMSFFTFLAVVWVVNDKTEPSFKMTWLVIIVAAPVFGVLWYMYVRTEVGSKRLNRKLMGVIRETKYYLKQDREVMQELTQVSPLTARLGNYMAEYAGYPIYQNTEAMYFPLGENAFEEMKKQLEKAEKFIFLEYFIIAPGYMWETILEILIRKVTEGVEVRLLYDGMNSFALLPTDYPVYMQRLGIKCKIFSPIRPILSTRQNHRDHRKILIVDGKVAFTGGINIGDEYINRKVRFGHWKDNAVMIHGDAVMSFTLMFLQMWNIEEKRLDNFDAYILKDSQKVPHHTDGYTLPYADSPLDDERVGEEVYLNTIHTAKRYVHIMTPYLVPAHEMLDSLKHGAKKGLDVKIIMPRIPDKWYVYLLARTYYEELLEAGVQIYEYVPGFVHAKTMVSDDRKAIVGTINLDYRSLYLHFEDGVYFYRNKVAEDVENDFQQTLKSCEKITLRDCSNLVWYKRWFGKVIRVLAPLM